MFWDKKKANGKADREKAFDETIKEHTEVLKKSKERRLKINELLEDLNRVGPTHRTR